MQKMVTAGCPDPEGDPSRVHGPRVLWLQQPRLVMAGCDVTQARVGVQGRFLDASGSTLQPKYSPIGGAAQRRLAARARRQTISAFEPLILPHAPLTNFGGIGNARRYWARTSNIFFLSFLAFQQASPPMGAN